MQISTKTEALPFADAFVPSVRYCITYVDDSRCKLTCHLGVKWLKWVMAKSKNDRGRRSDSSSCSLPIVIVTKAAFSGMSDSISIFVPILKEASCAVQKTVGNMQRSEVDSTESSTACANEDDSGESGIHTKLDGGVMTTAATLDRTSNHGSTMTEESAQLRKRSNSKLHQDHRTLSPFDVRLETSTASIISSTTLITALQGKAAYIRRSIKSATSSLRITTLMKTSFATAGPPYLWVVGVIMLLVCLLYVTIIPSSLPTTFDQSPLASHAVYLRDLDEGFLTKSMQPPYSGSKR